MPSKIVMMLLVSCTLSVFSQAQGDVAASGAEALASESLAPESLTGTVLEDSLASDDLSPTSNDEALEAEQSAAISDQESEEAAEMAEEEAQEEGRRALARAAWDAVKQAIEARGIDHQDIKQLPPRAQISEIMRRLEPHMGTLSGKVKELFPE